MKRARRGLGLARGRGRRPGAERAGLAVLAVLLVLLALLVLTAPFLMAARNASRASSERADRAQLALALDSAERAARADLGRSHPSVDPTPYSDDEAELAVGALDPRFFDASDAEGVMWQARATDVAGEIDLSSASPQVFANLLGATTRLTETLREDADQIAVSSTAGFEPQGFVWIGRELVGYGLREPQAFKQLARGLASAPEQDGESGCGPSPPADHDAGTPVIDQRAFAPVLWRNRVGDGRPRAFDGPEQIRAAAGLAIAGLGEEALELWEQGGTAFAGVRAGREWQRPARLTSSVEAGRDCRLRLDQPRWFAPGTTVQVADGRTAELGIVLGHEEGQVVLMEPLASDYDAFRAVVRPLARRPVNVNAASPATLEVLLTNLQLAGVNERITRTEARELARRIAEARPIGGFEDLLERVLLPAAGIEEPPEGAAEAVAPVIDPYDALAAYENALNANSSKLAYSTLPFSFTSREVFDLDLVAAVNAESGLERGRARRRAVELIVPQEELLQVFARQEDFDELLRLDGEAPWWATGPAATSRWDGGATPPSRFAAHVGTFRGELYIPGISELPEGWAEERPPAPTRVFASRAEDGWAQLWPARVAETHALRFVEHFDQETGDPEGRFLPDGPFELAADDERLGWIDDEDAVPLARCLNLSLWIKPRELRPGVLVDVRAHSSVADRVALTLEENELVLSVMDAMGDLETTPDFREDQAARYAFAGDGPGLLPDVWTHVAIDVRGNRPDQALLRIDGRELGVRHTGCSRLKAGLGATDTLLQLEDGSLFPERGVVRIGEEWIEYRKAGEDTLDASFRAEDPELPFAGGRLARVPFIVDPEDDRIPDPQVLQATEGVHPAGTPVELAGYTLPLRSAVHGHSGALTEAIGTFRVAVVDRVTGASGGDPIVDVASTVSFGRGLDAKSNATGLVLAPAEGSTDLSEAFHEKGGYAALVQEEIGTVQHLGQLFFGPHRTQNGLIGGVEVIRYSGFDGKVLQIAQRGALEGLAQSKAPRAFVTDWSLDFGNTNGWPRHEVFVVPISIPVSNAQAFVTGPDRSEFVQLTRRGDDFGLTEWVRYDSAQFGHLVRHSEAALRALKAALAIADGPNVLVGPPPGPGAGPGPASMAASALPPAAPGSPLAAALAAQEQAQSQATWYPYLGVEETDEAALPISRAANAALQFRGVLGTYQHPHPVDTAVLPTFRVDAPERPVVGQSQLAPEPDAGRPGRGDRVLLVDRDPGDIGFPAAIQHAWWPSMRPIYTWNDAARGVPVAGTMVPADEDQELLGEYHVALEEPFPAPIAPAPEGQTGAAALETRRLPRMLKYPSGERPRVLEGLRVGGDPSGGPAPAAVVDELAFGRIDFGLATSLGATAQGAPLVLAQDLPDGAEHLIVLPRTLRLPPERVEFAGDVLAGLPEDAGLLRIGSEILCYQGYDAPSGVLTLSDQGRGLLGTVIEHHPAGSSAAFLDDWTVTVLRARVSADASALPVADAGDFPPEGTVLVGDELVHYTRLRDGALEMPRASAVPGAMDGRGGGLFRGRFGTAPAEHREGAPVILFPFRYWDRQVERADAPELAYFGLAIDQPGAFWRNVFWRAEEVPGAQLYALQRAVDLGRGPAPPWDGEPGKEPGLALLEQGAGKDGEGNALALQADRLEWRVFVRYLPGAFDPVAGLSHAWKRSPRLTLFGAEYLGPNQVLWRAER